ncbi:MAG TPA: PEPxxWA-CTERM sorting domain-containing protein [Rhizomicrobium sp.]|jgi:hypothetical protein|nr:PEPxxWA-CTERM sorting domain-containing protein [Rhizomicrobium sp.]
MKIFHTTALTMIALTTLGVGAANAAVVLSDNFDASVAVLNWAGDATFVSIPGPGNVIGMPSVDLVGPADGFGILAFSGNSVDLDGTTGTGFSPVGEIQSLASLVLGNYSVSFELAGNLRGAFNQTTAVSIGSQTINITPSSNAQPYTLYTLNFVAASGHVDFKELGVSDQMGNLLDNVTVTSAVPEPAAWAMMIIGFGAVGFMMRGSRRNQAGPLRESFDIV